MRRFFIILMYPLNTLVPFVLGSPDPPVSEQINTEDRQYLESVYKATFDSLMYYVHPESGLPFDVSNNRKETSISNIGLYMATVAVGGHTGLIQEDIAVYKLNAAFDSLEKIQRWHGFPITWVNAETLERAFGPGFSYADHVGNLVSGLLVVKGIYPKQFSERVHRLIRPMDFHSTYDPESGLIRGGYHLEKRDFDIEQPWGKWFYSIFASDTRHYTLFGITLGQIPDSAWENLERSTELTDQLDLRLQKAAREEGKETLPYYAPGMQGAGLFMQYLPGIFLPEDELPVRISARNFAETQIAWAKNQGYFPMWGLSACESPDGKEYYGWGTMNAWVVTPHASVLAVEDFPAYVVANLKALEARGMRPQKKTPDGLIQDFGFTDSYDTTKKIASTNYLCLDQSMLFLALANYLHDNVVRDHFVNSTLGVQAADKLMELEKEKSFP